MSRTIYYTVFICFCLVSNPLSAGANDNMQGKQTMIAKGEFEIQLTPMSDEIEAGRMTINKVFSGDISGTSKGQMLSHRTNVEGSAGYVAIEHVTATLSGKSGGFTLQHSGTMSGSDQSSSVIVIPDSGTGELVGISGSMEIIMKDGQHFYEFTYNFEEK